MYEPRKRRTPRYPYTPVVDVRASGSGRWLALRAQDIGEDGMFLVCADAPELLTTLNLRLRGPQGQLHSLRARVVRVVTPAMAQRSGLEPGVGVQFEQLDPSQRALLIAVVEQARQADPRCRVPRRCLEPASDLPRDPMLAYLLTAIDGRRDPEQLAQQSMLDLDVVLEMLDALFREGQITFGPADTTDSISSPALGTLRDRARNDAVQAQTVVATELTAKQRQAIDEMLALVELAGTDHYALLGVAHRAPRKAVRAAFLGLAERFHPDAHHGKQLGAYRARLERVFDALSTAYAVLGTRERRQEYDRYLQHTQRVEEIQQQAAVVQESRPSPQRDPVAIREAQRRAAVRGLQRLLPPRAVEPPRAPAADVKRRSGAAPGQHPVRESSVRGLSRGQARPRRRALASQLLNEAEQGILRGDRASAVNQLDLMTRLGRGEADWQPRHQDRYDHLAHELADTIEQIARYEESHQQWSKAARSWTRLCEARTTDPECARRAAHALLQARGDLREAVRMAERAVALGPDDYRNHEVLGNALLAAKLPTRARRVLTHAAQLRAQAPGESSAQIDEPVGSSRQARIAP